MPSFFKNIFRSFSPPGSPPMPKCPTRSEEHTSELQSPCNLVCRLLLEKKKWARRVRHGSPERTLLRPAPPVASPQSVAPRPGPAAPAQTLRVISTDSTHAPRHPHRGGL